VPMPPPIPGVNGNWSCLNCQNVNFAVRTVCNRCTAPKPPHLMQQAKGRAPVAGVDGNWACPHCQNVNYAIRDACNRCQVPKPAEEAVGVEPPQETRTLVSMVAGKGISGRAPPVAGVDGNWACPMCQNVNYGIRMVCNRCQAPKPDAQPWPSQHGGKRGPMAGVDGNWECITCRNVNFAMREVCNICQRPKPREVAPPPQLHVVPCSAQQAGPGRSASRAPVAGVDGNWACPSCRNVNFGVREVCNRCQAPKPQPQWGGSGSRGGPPVAGVDGNWACIFCGNVNYGIREACNRCQAPQPSEEELLLLRELLTPADPPLSKDPAHGRAPVAGVDGNWACRYCGNVNFAVREACNRCRAPKEQPQLSPGRPTGRAPIAGVNGNWACPQCRNVNFPNRVVCNRCQAPMPRGRVPGKAPIAGVDGNWACPLCNNVNFGIREACNRCQAPKPREEPPGEDFMDPDAALIEQLLRHEDEDPPAKRLKS